MLGDRQLRSLSKLALYALAFVALLFKAYVPSGFMVAAGGTVVICTGMGPMQMPDHRPKAPAAPEKQKPDHPCPFAGNAAPPLPPTLSAQPESPISIEARIDEVRFDLIPGRGLAAPPPPSRAPPLSLA